MVVLSSSSWKPCSISENRSLFSVQDEFEFNTPLIHIWLRKDCYYVPVRWMLLWIFAIEDGRGESQCVGRNAGFTGLETYYINWKYCTYQWEFKSVTMEWLSDKVPVRLNDFDVGYTTIRVMFVVNSTVTYNNYVIWDSSVGATWMYAASDSSILTCITWHKTFR